MSGALPLSIILPAHDEAAWIEGCLASVMASDPVGAPVEVIVVANGCSDDTAARARAVASADGMDLRVIDLPEGGKTRALNAGDAAARHAARVYLDADVRVEPALLAAMARRLHTDAPCYVCGTPRLSRNTSRISRAYGRFWMELPFNTEGVGGYGLFAVNGAGRARWQDWPEVISDDTYARLSFAPGERVKLAEGYEWPLVEGFSNLVRVRRRQNRGVGEIAERFPELLANEPGTWPDLRQILRLAFRHPAGFAVYAGVALAVRSGGGPAETWARGR